MVQKITLSIPKTFNNQFHSIFYWTFTLLDSPALESRVQYFFTCKYVELENIIVNGFRYEKLIFDFLNRKIHIYISDFDEEALRNILHSITIKSSPTSQLFCLYPHKRPKTNK